MPDIESYARLGMEIAVQAGQLSLERFHTDFTVSHKGTVNLVTDVDLAAEELIVSRIRKEFPDHLIIAEERHSQNRGEGIVWIIDPLDGTTNYAHGYPVFSVSIGLEIKGKVEWGVVFDPTRNELFSARRGFGATCNGVQLSVSKTPSLGASLLATGFPYDIQTDSRNNLDNFCAFAVRTQGVRRAGSAAIDLCYVAAGRFDGFWELKLNPWDCAAGSLIVTEAGGMVTNFAALPASIYEREIVASNGLIHAEMLDVLKKIRDSRFEINLESRISNQKRGPMRLRDKISADLMAAMKSKQAARLSVLRMMKAAIRNKEIDSRQELDDPQAVQVLLSLIKQRKDSIEQFKAGNRLDLADKETAEIKVIEEYLPAAVTDEEIGTAIDSAISETGAASIKDMGKVMKACMARFSGRPVDGAKVSELVKARLAH